MKRKLLKFSAHWCGPCKSLSLVLSENKQVLDDVNIQLEDIDVDKNVQMAQDYEVRSIPHLVLLDDKNKVLKSYTGLLNVEELKKFISSDTD